MKNRFYYDSGVAVVDVSTPKHPGAMMLMDADDYRRLRGEVGRINCFKERGVPYARCRKQVQRGQGRQPTLIVHRLLGLGVGGIDHANGNGLDNRRENLRLATGSQNNSNSPKRAWTSSRFKGVSWHRKYGKWQAGIKCSGSRRFLGFFFDETEAACAYDRAAVAAFGEFACVNFPEHFPGLKVRRA